jgi:hypothetical protein
MMESGCGRPGSSLAPSLPPSRSSVLKRRCHEIFCFCFFHESVFPQPQSIPFRPFQIFSTIRGDIRESRCTTGISDTCHRFQQHRWQIFPPFSLALLIPVANLPPVSTIPAVNFSTIFASIVDTGGKFATGVLLMSKERERGELGVESNNHKKA